MRMSTSAKNIPVLGLTGGIGSGKSTALAYLHELGAATISSDEIVHGLYSTAEVIDRIREHFGPDVVDGAGGVSRPALAGIVFSDEEALRWLEDLLHPFVRTAVADWVEAQRKARPRPALIVVEVPLLFETGFEQRFDYVMLITAPVDVRRKRVTAKLTDSEFRRRRAQQMPEEEKVGRSDFVFDNGGSRKQLREFVGETVARILAGDEQAVGDGAQETAP
jgi:dephospho-CoA kinase